MKRFFSALFSLIVLAAICAGLYFYRDFVRVQINKVRGVYYVYQGDKAYKNLKMNKAINYYNLGVSLYPQHYGAWYNLGNIYVAYEDYSSALHAYAHAFKYNPKLMPARMNYGIVSAEKMGDYNGAIDQYNKIIKTKRKLISIPYVYNNKNSYRENKAIAYYNKGVTYRMKSLYTAGDNWELQRKYLARAIEAYKKSLKIEPKNYDTLYNLGIAYQLAGNYEDAGLCYCKAIAVQPLNYEAHYNLAVLLRRMRHFQEAYDEIIKAATLISQSNAHSEAMEYVSVVMNDITKTLYGFSENDNSSVIIENDEEKIKDSKNKKNKKNLLVKGKVVPQDDLDSKIIKNYKSCPALKYFTY